MTVLATRALPSAVSPKLAIALLGRKGKPDCGAYHHYEDLTLTTYADGAGATNWTGAGVRVRSRREEEPSRLELACMDLNADGRDEIIVVESYSGCGWDPGVYRVFTIADGAILPVGEVSSEEVGCERFLEAGGRDTVPFTYAIGGLAHLAQPRWTDYYRYDGTRLVIANNDRPALFRKWPDELRGLLKDRPDDAELWYFLGRALLILSNDGEALDAFRRASDLGYRAYNSGFSDVSNWQ